MEDERGCSIAFADRVLEVLDLELDLGHMHLFHMDLLTDVLQLLAQVSHGASASFH